MILLTLDFIWDLWFKGYLLVNILHIIVHIFCTHISSWQTCSLQHNKSNLQNMGTTCTRCWQLKARIQSLAVLQGLWYFPKMSNRQLHQNLPSAGNFAMYSKLFPTYITLEFTNPSISGIYCLLLLLSCLLLQNILTGLNKEGYCKTRDYKTRATVESLLHYFHVMIMNKVITFKEPQEWM